MPTRYDLRDARRSFRWLGHAPFHTELAALHPDYRPGRENTTWNRERNAYPRVTYATNEAYVLGFVRRFADSRMVCYSLNPRARLRLDEHGFPVASRETDVLSSQNLLLDFDLEGQPTRERIENLGVFLRTRLESYFSDQRFAAPERACSGAGYHLLAGYERILVSQRPDVCLRLREFRDQVYRSFRHELAALEARLDQTQDLRRLVKIYGTAKPGGPVSRFYGDRRREDPALREHLLALKVRPSPAKPVRLDAEDQLPAWFEDLLRRDPILSRWWRGEGKPHNTDTTRSGFDYSITRRLLDLGHTDVQQLATILARRPGGGVKGSGKGEDYIRRTIASALIR